MDIFEVQFNIIVQGENALTTMNQLGPVADLLRDYDLVDQVGIEITNVTGHWPELQSNEDLPDE